MVILKVSQLLNVSRGESCWILQQLNDAIIDGLRETVRERCKDHGNAIDPQVNVLTRKTLLVVENDIEQSIAHF